MGHQNGQIKEMGMKLIWNTDTFEGAERGILQRKLQEVHSEFKGYYKQREI